MWELIRANRRRTALLVVLMALLLVASGWAVGEIAAPGAGPGGLVLALAVWAGLTLAAWTSGDRILLAASGARRIGKADHPVLWNVVEELCIAAGLSRMPDVYIIDEAAPNAFATGRSPERAAVAVTAGLLERLDRDELQGVVAHELGHIKNRDVLYMTMAGVMLGAVVMLADVATRVLWRGPGIRRTSSRRGGGGQAALFLVGIVLAILSPILARLMYLALSRRREYLADASAALYTRYPEGLASALEKIALHPEPLRAANRTTAPMYIVNPLATGERFFSVWTSTHPPTAERVRILRALGGGALSLERYDEAFRRVTGRPVGVVPRGARAAREPIEPREARPDARSHPERVRELTDALWHAQGYLFLPCACGTTLKVPPSRAGGPLACPRCGSAVRSRGET